MNNYDVVKSKVYSTMLDFMSKRVDITLYNLQFIDKWWEKAEKKIPKGLKFYEAKSLFMSYMLWKYGENTCNIDMVDCHKNTFKRKLKEIKDA